jgi:pyruvate formate lyase activating enzyme
MDIKGFQKLTLLDYPGKVACTIFTGGCNFRCPFCHNSGLIINPENTESIYEDTILDYLRMRKGILDAVCVTGGEPLLQKDLKQFLAKVREIGYFIKIDTNGFFPKVLQNLIDENLVDYVAMDIKNSLEKYPVTAGVKNLDTSKIIESVQLLMNSSIDYEFRTTVTSELHKEDDFLKIGKWLANAKAYYLQNYKDSDNVLTKELHSLSKNELIDAKTILKQYIDNTFIRGE